MSRMTTLRLRDTDLLLIDKIKRRLKFTTMAEVIREALKHLAEKDSKESKPSKPQ